MNEPPCVFADDPKKVEAANFPPKIKVPADVAGVLMLLVSIWGLAVTYPNTK